jgi:alpha-tubulin suppressor-like RCC1 family protein
MIMSSYLIKRFVTAIFLSIPAVVLSQVTEQWVSKYNGPGLSFDEGNSVAVDGSGNIYVTGSSEGNGTALDYVTIKFNTLGIKQWVVRYDGPASSDDEANSIIVDEAGNVYVTGVSEGDYTTIKYNDQGVLEWIARYDLPFDFGIATHIVLDAAGNVYVTGKSDDGNDPNSLFNWDFVTVKYNSEGVEQWVARFDKNNDFESDDIPYDIAVDVLGNVYVCGESSSALSLSEFITIKYNSTGVQQWIKSYSVEGDFLNGVNAAKSLEADAAGNIYVTGISQDTDVNTGNSITVKYDSEGAVLWLTRHTGNVSLLALDLEGFIYVAGNLIVLKISNEGAIQWTASYNEGFLSQGENSLAVDNDGNVYVNGQRRFIQNDDAIDIVTVKYSSLGEEQWVQRYGDGVMANRASSLAVDEFSNVYVAGHTGLKDYFDIDESFDLVTIKYLPNCGTNEDKLWVCHKGRTICILPADAPDHIGHGDYFGHCIESYVLKNNTNINLSELQQTEGGALNIINYPNPFTGKTTIQYNISVEGYVTIKIYDITGKEITTLTQSHHKAGKYNISFAAVGFQSGTYLLKIRLKSKEGLYTRSRKMLFIR